MSCAGSCQPGRRPCDCKPVLRVITRSGLDFDPVEPDESIGEVLIQAAVLAACVVLFWTVFFAVCHVIEMTGFRFSF